MRGQAMVEFAIVAPLFFLMLFAIIEFGWYVYQVQTLNDAVREATRYAIVHGSTSLCPSGPLPGGAPNGCDPSGAKVQAIVRNYSVGLSSAGLSFPTMTWSPDDGRGGIFVLVAQANFQPLIPWVPLPTITIQGGSSDVIQH
ncbi:MAG TPA: TadE/TadG family type IV pilus assembly protein [Candidatus Limnocylindrales bacterium]